jgi:hypothetical protein
VNRSELETSTCFEYGRGADDGRVTVSDVS